MYGNLDSGIINKKDEIYCLIQEKNPDVLIFNEILPKKHRKKKKISLKDYTIDGYESFLPSTLNGRGVVIYYKPTLSVNNVDLLTNSDFNESVWIRIKLKGSDSLLIGNIYRSPSSSCDNNLNLHELLRHATDLKD